MTEQYTRGSISITKEDNELHPEWMSDFGEVSWDMLLINYEAPTGEKRHKRLWNGGNGIGTIELYHKGKLVDRIHCENIGCEYGEFDHPEAYEK